MKCKFCGAEVRVGETCQYCGSFAEPSYYGSEPQSKPEEKPEKTKKKPKTEKTANQREYTVQKGDCLWNIAKKFYGNGAAYWEIAEKNGIKNPNLIYPGQVLKI